MPIGRFINGVAVVIWRADQERYLLLRRAATKDYGAGEWETVTGRVDQGESYIDALHREVREELNVSAQVDFVIGVTHFYRGEEVPENELLGVMFCCSTPTPDAIQRSEEHDAHQWMTLSEIQATFAADGWLRRCIERADLMQRLLPDEIRQAIQEDGLSF
jgi:8-oxo-dGTP pyrophosphatase MutT (NUDIX family)